MTSAPSKPRVKALPDPDRAAGAARTRSDERRFPSVRAVQAGRAYFVTACPLHLVPDVLTFDSPDLPPQLRAQRILNKARIPRIARYITSNPSSYVLSAITASIDGDVRFETSGSLESGVRLGQLVIPDDARILVNDGQHRRAAITDALATMPELSHESVPLVLFLDAGLARSQQIFADLNRHGIRSARSLNALYDHRDEAAGLARRVATEVCPFQGLTELEKSSLSNRTSCMFTLSAIHQATTALLRAGGESIVPDQRADIALDFWRIVGHLIRNWGFIGDGATAADLRRDYIHVHAVALHALGMVGGELITHRTDEWRSDLRKLSDLDWSRNNPTWDGRALRNGRISKAGPSLILTSNVLKASLELPLSETEQALETSLPKEHRVAA